MYNLPGNGEIQDLFVTYLDRASALALVCSNRFSANVCSRVHGLTIAPVRPSQSHAVLKTVTGPSSEQSPAMETIAAVAPVPSRTNSQESAISDEDFPLTPGTDVTTPDLSTPDGSECGFNVTADVVRRLSLLPPVKHGASLSSLPTELQLEIFSYLDRIDSVCFGLTSSRLYAICRAMYGTKIPLNTRRVGPNSLESAWKIDKQQCRQCGMFRCELWQHIKTWMPKDLEYCSMKHNFGLPAKEGASESCYRGKPSKPRRCGRHPVRTTTIHQDDNNLESKL